ncbi:MAG: ABC-type sugar transport system periplasmic component-like protein [Aeromicrobium sp.]|nr:ABC-type sugar transport system periplasmic component-like protein [Aeromicrobium sp.]
MKIVRFPSRQLVGAAAALAAVSVLAACGSDSSSGTGSSGTPKAAADASTTLDKLATGYESAVPTEGPAPAAGKTVWWISCGQSIPDCSKPAAAAQKAAETLGIDFHIADGKLNVGGGNATAIRTALATGPDAIIIHGMSCSTVKQPLEEAKAAGALIMGVEALDCSDEKGGGAGLFSAPMLYSDSAPSVIDYFKSWGAIGAAYLAAVTDGKVQAINNGGIEPLQVIQSDGFIEGLAKCGTCKIVDTVHYGSPDYGPSGTWINQFRAALAKNPTANATVFPTDAMMSFSGGTQAIAGAGREVMTVGGTGSSTGMDLVRSGDQTAITGAHDPIWMGYGAMDNMNRALNGEDAVPQGIGAVLVDKDHNMPVKAGSDYTSKVDYVAAYTALWGK